LLRISNLPQELVCISQKQFSTSRHFSTFIALVDIKPYGSEQMPGRKVKNDNKQKELIEKFEPVEDEIEDSAEQINIEEEPKESERPK
jgi:hypothetical protein